MSEANARIIINKRLKEADWILPGDEGVVNVNTEMHNRAGFADYVLMDRSGFPLCIIEAKKNLLDPLVGKEQARDYAKELGCRFVILSNSLRHYFWDLEQGNPTAVDRLPTQAHLELRKSSFNPPRQETEEIGVDYIAQTQFPNLAQHPDYRDENKRAAFLDHNQLKLLRDYQLNAVKAVQQGIKAGEDRFLLEMATGTGKTLVASSIIKMFLRLYGVKRVLFLVDRIELESQAQKEFDAALQNDFATRIWKKSASNWKMAEIVVSTVQSFIGHNKYRKLFKPDDFQLVISDEAHRSLGAKSRKVFEYFIGFKLGLTATPKDYLKSVDLENIAKSDPRQLEKRLMLDTYTTFGCERGEPTFRYGLQDGVRDGYLTNPKVINVKTAITTALLAEQGYVFQGVDEQGKDVEETFTYKDFEKRFFSENTNKRFCEIFLKHALRDPCTGEIGKTLVFCISQNHAAKLTQILNVMADSAFPNRYHSDFAVQVTSNVDHAQQMTVDFRNNKLNGESQYVSGYKTSRTRVCVTVGMMTTGYDCTDILNICMMRPVFSASEFVQMKGRGTRRHDFSKAWTGVSEMLDHIATQKEKFLLFDFFGNYDYFEKDFDYDEVLALPTGGSGENGEPPPPIDEAISTAPDPLAELKEILISDQGMKVDRELYRSFEQQIRENKIIKEFVKQQNFKDAETYLQDKIWDKPAAYFTLEKLRKSLRLDRPLTVGELLLYVFGHIPNIPSKQACLDEEFDQFDRSLHPDDAAYNDARRVFEAYTSDEAYRGIIESGEFAKLNFDQSGEAFRNLPQALRQQIPAYIRKHVDLEKFAHVG